MSETPAPPRAVAAEQAMKRLEYKNQPPSDHAVATVAISLLAVADAITSGAREIAKSNREVADAIRQAGRWNAR